MLENGQTDSALLKFTRVSGVVTARNRDVKYVRYCGANPPAVSPRVRSLCVSLQKLVRTQLVVTCSLLRL